MLQISERGKSMPESAIRKLVPFAEKAKKEGVDIYHLNIGQPDILTPTHALNAIKNNDLKIVEYTHSAGNESLRKKMAKYYQDLDIDIDYSEILITTGGSEAISMTLTICFNQGDELLVPEPYYANYNGFASPFGIVIKPVTSIIENGFALPPIEEFEKSITSKTKGIIVNNPNNPTGHLYSFEEMQQLKEVVKKHNLFLISDEVYREFCYDNCDHYSALKLEGIEDNVILIDSFSKRYSACGIRIGALVTRNKKISEIALRIGNARLSPPTYGQIAAEAMLDTPLAYFKKVSTEYQQRRDYTVKALNEMDGVYSPVPMGAFYTMARFPIDNSDKFAKWLLTDFRYNNQTVMVAPGTGFYTTKEGGNNELRIAYVLNIESLKESMECLKKALEEYSGKKM